MQSFLFGVLVIGIGGGIGYYSHYLVELFGRIERADRNLGGTRQGYLLGSFVVMIVGFCIMFGIINLSGTQQLPAIQGPASLNTTSPQ